MLAINMGVRPHWAVSPPLNTATGLGIAAIASRCGSRSRRRRAPGRGLLAALGAIRVVALGAAARGRDGDDPHADTTAELVWCWPSAPRRGGGRQHGILLGLVHACPEERRGLASGIAAPADRRPVVMAPAARCGSRRRLGECAFALAVVARDIVR